MTRIPKEHHAARELYDEFARVGAEQRADARLRSRRPWRRWRMRRALALVPAALLTLVAGAGAARILFDDGAPVSGDRAAPPDTRRAINDTALAAVRAADPDSGLPWGVRLYSNTAGGRCAIAGRVQGRTLGVVREGRFVALAPDAPGACGAPDARMLIARRENAEAPRRSVLYGFVDRSVTGLQIVERTRRETVPVASDGSFLVVVERRLRGRLVISTRGRQIVRDLS